MNRPLFCIEGFLQTQGQTQYPIARIDFLHLGAFDSNPSSEAVEGRVELERMQVMPQDGIRAD